MIKKILDEKIQKFRNKRKGINPGIVIIHPNDYYVLLKLMQVTSMYTDVKFYESTTVPEGNPTLAIAETQVFVPLTNPNHASYHRHNLASIVQIEFKK